ncbi:FeoB-associated Cys-rich membrane protein [uncultured Winogradskyella sp.]|nr:FeoB-associated Cys-rich membrane protein [uncultured Winogradskyella sp.]
MNDSIQNILVFITIGLALTFLVRKFIWKPKKKVVKACGNDGCGCH